MFPILLLISFGQPTDVGQSAPAETNELRGQLLPLISNWNTGQNPQGFTPDWQLTRLMEGDKLLPWFELFNDLQPNDLAARAGYFQPLFEHCRIHRLPIHFVGDNVIDWMRTNDTVPDDSPVFLAKENGQIVKRASPFGAVEPWYAHGTRVARYLRPFHDAYPEAPWVLVSDNNEAGTCEVAEAVLDRRRPAELTQLMSRIAAETDEAKKALLQQSLVSLQRELVEEGYGKRYAEFRRALRDGLPRWGDRLKFVAYGSFGQEFGAAEYQPDSTRYRKPWGREAVTHDGVWANVGYIQPWGYAPWFVRSPQVEACNVRYSFDRYRQIGRLDYLCGLLFWEGRPAWYRYLGSEMVTPRQWLGCARATLWIVHPDHVMHFAASSSPAVAAWPYFDPLIQAVNEIHNHPALRRFWLEGKIAPNAWRREPTRPEDDTGFGHPYVWMTDPEHNTANRWFLLHAPINERLQFDERLQRWQDRWLRERSHQTPVEVFAVAYRIGEETLLLAHATRENRDAVEIHVPRIGPVRVDCPVEGRFYLLTQGRVEAVE
jgi:hypothetical protein